jgi:two-component system response regulator MprA
VLVFVDDRGVRFSMRNLLAVAELEALLATDGVDALRLLERRPICAAVIDLMMPRLDGVGVVRAIVGLPPERRPGVVFVISGRLDLHRRVMGLPVRRVFPKPFDPIALLDELVLALSTPGSCGQSPPAASAA